MSNNGSCGRPWTPYEDDLLRAAVAIYGDNTEKWKTIALSVPGRTNKACRKRWLHSLSPSVKKSAWTPGEDQLLLSLFERHPNKWSRIAREIPGRTDDACSKRYREALDPNLKKDEWTEEEDKHLLDALTRHGGTTNPKWVLIGQELRRSSLGCRNRWRLLERKRKASLRRDNVSGSQQSFEDPVAQDSLDLWSLLAGSGSSSDWDIVLNSLSVSLEGLSGPEVGHDVEIDVPLGERIEVSHQAAEVVSTESHAISNQHDDMSSSAVTALPQDPRIIASLSSTSSEIEPNEQNTEPIRPTGSTVPSTPNLGSEASPGYSFDPPIPDVIDYGASGDSDSFCLYGDADTRVSCQTEQNGSRETSEEQHRTPEAPGDAQTSNSLFTRGTETFGSLGTLAQAASTLSPSPLVGADARQERQGDRCIPLPPRKRRRPAADSLAHAGIHVISDISGRPRSEPKLSSSLPVAGDVSILAYVCGHSACSPAGTTEGASRYSTSGELLNHYKDKHMDDAGTSNETPFRCGLSGCNKGWRSINGLQYHLQISKVHYQLVCSRAASANRQSTDQGSTAGSSEAGSPTSDSASHHSRGRTHRCPHPGCLKEYKQLSGLRYHLLHGHPKDIPTQLHAIPPRIAKQLGVQSAPATCSGIS